jgi:hypothetical protein
VQRNAALDPNIAKHPDDGMKLSAADQRALVAFLKTLTDVRYVEEGNKGAASLRPDANLSRSSRS